MKSSLSSFSFSVIADNTAVTFTAYSIVSYQAHIFVTNFPAELLRHATDHMYTLAGIPTVAASGVPNDLPDKNRLPEKIFLPSTFVFICDSLQITTTKQRRATNTQILH